MMPHQQPPVEAPLQFCPTSIAAISSTLNVLNTAGNRLEDLQELTPLRLSTLDLSENKIRQVGELKEVISGDVLRRVTLQGNPFAFHDRRYRSAVVLCSTAIEEIDGREVLPQETWRLVVAVSRTSESAEVDTESERPIDLQERDFVRRLDEQKRKLNVASLGREEHGIICAWHSISMWCLAGTAQKTSEPGSYGWKTKKSWCHAREGTLTGQCEM
ncbi:unnamed protein product [Cladocopium goreaui]|uniref:Protein phosphatase 1 regulatory subunit 42 (Leucine-rich repeat-containing protein 67) n=1 Tax=Cladocopium goreaui TaxID=2562237 RepID=A0A9P1CTR4_9DINO|nr:unnamed protein product [Cladocopium goreaui]